MRAKSEEEEEEKIEVEVKMRMIRGHALLTRQNACHQHYFMAVVFQIKTMTSWGYW